ncbi:unnamed protein product [Cercospora beticola]|nr:unnamed protein product [Cercospora beticola]
MSSRSTINVIIYLTIHSAHANRGGEHYQPEEQSCPQVYVEYCRRQRGVVDNGRKIRVLNIDPPCAFCQLRTPGSLDYVSPCLILIKASAGTGVATDEACKNVGFVEYAILGQLFWEINVSNGSVGKTPRS